MNNVTIQMKAKARKNDVATNPMAKSAKTAWKDFRKSEQEWTPPPDPQPKKNCSTKSRKNRRRRQTLNKILDRKGLRVRLAIDDQSESVHDDDEAWDSAVHVFVANSSLKGSKEASQKNECAHPPQIVKQMYSQGSSSSSSSTGHSSRADQRPKSEAERQSRDIPKEYTKMSLEHVV